MEKRQTILWATVVLASGAGLAYLYFADYHRVWNPTGHPGKSASTTDKSISAAVTSPGAKEATFEDRWEVGRPINPPFSIDRDELLTNPTVPPLMRALDLGDMVLAKSLIAGGANVNATDRN